MGFALQNLFQDRTRLLLSVVGVAFAVMLILFLLGMRAGMFRSAVIYLDNAPGSVVVAPSGVTSSSAGLAQLVSSDTANAVAATPGVAAVTPVLQMYVIPEFHGEKEIIKLTGYTPALGGGPWKLAEGREPEGENEVVLDKVLARRHRFAIGDSFDVAGRTVRLVGLSSQTSSWTGDTYLFASKSFVESIALTPGASSFLLVTPAKGTSEEELVDALSEVPGASVLLKSRMMANDEEVVAGIADQTVFLMVAAAFVVGALVVGMVVYTATMERRAEYGILRAIGARASLLYRVVAVQAIVAAGLGALLGVGFAFVMGQVVMNQSPQFLVLIELPAIFITLAAGLVMALAGALFPARAVARVAPAEVFRR